MRNGVPVDFMVQTSRLDSNVKESMLLLMTTSSGAGGRKLLPLDGVMDCGRYYRAVG